MNKFLLAFTLLALSNSSKAQHTGPKEIQRFYSNLKKIDSLPTSLIQIQQDCFIMCEVFLKGKQIDSLLFSGCDNPDVRNLISASVMKFRFHRNPKVSHPIIIPFLFKLANKGDNINMNLGLRELDLKKLLPFSNKFQLSTAIILPPIYVLHYGERKAIR